MISFARDEDGQLKKKQPCQTPGCEHPNWHICLIGKPDTTPQILANEPRSKRRENGPRTESHREAIAQSQRERWARIKAQHQQRDAQIVSRYKAGGVSTKDLMKEFDVGQRVIQRVLHEARDAGELEMRGRGFNIRHGF